MYNADDFNEYFEQYTSRIPYYLYSIAVLLNSKHVQMLSLAGSMVAGEFSKTFVNEDDENPHFWLKEQTDLSCIKPCNCIFKVTI